MDKYIQHYLTMVERHKKKAFKIIHKELKNNLKNYKNWTFACNTINDIFQELKADNIIYDPRLSSVLKAYHQAKANNSSKHQLKAISVECKNEFKKIKTIDITFNEYISNLALDEAYYKIGLILNHSNSLRMMYELEKLEGYNHFPKFTYSDFINKLPPEFDFSEKIYSELRSLRYPPTFIEKKEGPVENSRTKKPFEISYEYVQKFRSERVYNYLEQTFFDDFENSYDKYLDVFFKHPNDHSSFLKLTCTTQMFSYFLQQFKCNFVNTISFNRIENAELFKTNTLGQLRANNIAKSSKSVSDIERSVVDNTIRFIKDFKPKNC